MGENIKIVSEPFRFTREPKLIFMYICFKETQGSYKILISNMKNKYFGSSNNWAYKFYPPHFISRPRPREGFFESCNSPF
jgi:hypothetical protein